MTTTIRSRTAQLAACALAALAGTAAAQPAYDFTLVEAFTANYNLRYSYIWDINDQGLACGTATREFQEPNGSGIRDSGFTWTLATDKTPLDVTTLPRGVNNGGWVVGERVVFDLTSGTTVATIPYPPGGTSTMEALGVNDAGTVVGYAQTCACSNSQGLLQVPFVWDPVNGTRGLAVPGAKELVRINAGTLAAGNIRAGSGGGSGFVYDIASGSYTILSELVPPGQYGQRFSRVTDINDAGVLTGHMRDPGNAYRIGFVWSPTGGFTFFPAFGPTLDVYPSGINNAGTAVGYAIADPSASVPFHAFVWDAQHGIRDLNGLAQGIPAGFVLDRALKINEQGWIVGDGHYGPNWGTSRAFVLRPLAASCYANCDNSTQAPVLNVADFSCFLSRFAAGDPYANCDGSAQAPVLNVADFSCFLQKYAAGCP